MKIFGRFGLPWAPLSRALSAAVVVSLFTLSACSPNALSNAVPSFSNAGSTSTATRSASDLANVAGGALGLPGGGALGLPGGGALALPGGDLLGSINLSALTNLLFGLLSPCAVVGLVVGQAQCNALLNPNVPVNPNPNLSVWQISGYHPSDLRAAYNIPSSGGSGRIVATIVAGDDPTAENDLGVYRHAFGLTACTTANGCFHKVNQSGAAGSYPASLTGWAQEAGIDIEMISAVCPSCSVLLVEANSAQLSDLEAAVDTAVNLGATVVNNSYYAPEYNGELTDEQHYNHPGVAVTVSAGDVGYGATFPASSRYVTSVGGTTLSRGLLGLGWSQTVWGATGSGCSTYVPKPDWQKDTGCTNRTLNDISAVADPLTGVAVYNSTAPSGQVGWGVYGGTSVSAPIVAGMYALSSNAGNISGASYAYGHTGNFHEVTSGSNGQCTPSYLCNGGFGYNGPAGLGTPSGDGGF
jgi:subtilase family serine protease